MQLADEIVIIAGGKIADRGPKEQIFPQLLQQLGEENSCNFRKESE